MRHDLPADTRALIRALHRLEPSELARAGSPVHRSYTRFLLDLARFVARAWGPRGRRVTLSLP